MDNNHLQNIKKLLTDVGTKIEKSDEIARLKGENFNIFSILGVETKENKTHSNFLVSLLDPNGKHGLGDAFLQYFYDTIFSNESGISLTDEKRQIIDNLKQDKVDVQTELYLGKTNYDIVEGGRVDISIQGNKGKIFIENKIYAGDQHLQIARYIKGKKAVVLYLTLHGNEPSKNSSGNYEVNEDFFLLSYKTDIKNWLEKCQKEASDYPILRETIKQYLILIKKLTGQLTSNEMEDKIQEAILKELDAAEAIVQNIEKAKQKVQVQYIDIVKVQFKDYFLNTDKKANFELINDKGKYSLGYRNPKWIKEFMYYFETSPNGTSRFGLVLWDKKKYQYQKLEKIYNILGEKARKVGNDAWISYPIEIVTSVNSFLSNFNSSTDKISFIEKEIMISIFEYIEEIDTKIDDLLKELNNM